MTPAGGYIITTSRERQPWPFDWSCSGHCDEAMPAEDGPEVGVPICPACGAAMVRAPYCIAVPRWCRDDA
jgi:hypothetical protein